MALERREVSRDHLRALFDLKVRKDQAGLVAPNEITLAQAAYEGKGAYVWGLWADGIAIGLIAMIHPREYQDLEEDDDPDAAYIWRLMIGADHQGKGFGHAALDIAAQQARDWGLPKVALTVVDSPNGAIPFYERAGFRKTGRIVDGEVEMVRPL